MRGLGAVSERLFFQESAEGGRFTVSRRRRAMAGEGRLYSDGRSQQVHNSSDSDSDGGPARGVCGAGPPGVSFPGSQVIHSGHFMVSSPHSDGAQRGRKSGGSTRYDFDTVNRTWCHTYRYGPLSSGSLSIDPTLTRLFDCMSLAYRWVPSCRRALLTSFQVSLHTRRKKFCRHVACCRHQVLNSTNEL